MRPPSSTAPTHLPHLPLGAQKGISYAVQKNLNNLKGDCQKLLLRMDEAMAQDLDKNAQNRCGAVVPGLSPQRAVGGGRAGR